MDLLDRMVFDGGALFLFVVIAVPLLALAIPYVVLRLRDVHSRTPDPQLGYRIGLHFFFSLSLLLVEFGLTIIAVDLFMGLDLGGQGARMAARGELFLTVAQRNGLAMVVSGGLFLLVYFLSLVFLSAESAGISVRRTFLGWRFAIHGMVVLPCITGVIMVLLQRVDQPELFQMLVGTLLIWLPSWFIHFMLLRRLSAPAMPEEGPFFLDRGSGEDDEERRRRRPVED